MDVKFKYTKHQVVRGSKPDAEDYKNLYLIKNTSELRATYQVRLLAYKASGENRKLVIRLPVNAKIHASLRRLRGECGKLIKIEKV